MGYAKKTLIGFSWQTIYKAILVGVAIVKMYFLARLLDPQAFGLFSLTAITLGITESLTQTGINVTILQSKDPIKSFINTAWVVAIIRGFVIGSIMLLMGIFMQQYYQEPQLLVLIAVAALIPIIKGFINPYIVVLHKEMRFFQDSLYRFSLIFVESLAAVILGFLTHSVWALVLALIIGAIYEVIISFVFFKLKPKFIYLPSKGKSILQNAKWLSVSTVLNYLNERADDFVLGKMFGTHSLGIYSNAYSLGHKPNYDFSKSAHHSTLPAFTQLADSPLRLQRAFYRSLFALIALISFASLPLILFPGPLIKLVLGDQWLAAIPFVRPLVFAGIIQSISNQGYALFLARKQYKILNLHLVTSLSLMILLIVWWGSTNQLLGAVYGILVARAIALPLVFIGILNKKNEK
jgi:lipopolysaccharide exporter